ncbi:MAG: hypothetical protein WBE86_00290 [Candidatus Acidiferrales bacterium]
MLFHGEPGRVEFVAIDKDAPETGWYVAEYGGGVMIADQDAGHTFISADQIDDHEDLEFVSRGDASSATTDESVQ